jgi:hypothetical protein
VYAVCARQKLTSHRICALKGDCACSYVAAASSAIQSKRRFSLEKSAGGANTCSRWQVYLESAETLPCYGADHRLSAVEYRCEGGLKDAIPGSHTVIWQRANGGVAAGQTCALSSELQPEVRGATLAAAAAQYNQAADTR